MATDDNGIPLSYYEAPNSLLEIDDDAHSGLLAIGALAAISVLFTTALLGFITWRMISWRAHYTRSVGRNQCIVLIYQLILADFIQSLGFLISFHWASEGKIVGPNGACFAQGWMIQAGDVASAFFVLAIAVHTTYQVMYSRNPSYNFFLAMVIGVWAVALLLTCLAPIIGGRYVFMRAGVWCWISVDHEDLRLLLHYLWIFIVQFGAILVYASGFYYLFRAKRPGAIMIQGASVEALNKAARAMLAYAIVYTILTLPLAAGRMASMSGHELSNTYYFFAGCLFTSCGFIDTLLYAFTRRTLLFNELDFVGTHEPDRNDKRDTHVGYPRNNSTDDMLAETGFGNFGGIKMERTVKVELDDLGSEGSAESGISKFHYSAQAEAHAS
ncbi:G protein-coupled glucose receptor regulating Gpa2-domain-containing protein [Biscogniauxia mediterranea]|nr:G protein-coupled glucose receptor regulating Gpa2-domain-containing protein [Biscogniauxia mediterranea]